MNQRGGRLGFVLTKMGDKIILPVEIARLDNVEICEHELTDTGTREHSGDIGAKSAETGDADAGAAHGFVHFWRMPRRHHVFQYIARRQYALFNQGDAVTVR